MNVYSKESYLYGTLIVLTRITDIESDGLLTPLIVGSLQRKLFVDGSMCFSLHFIRKIIKYKSCGVQKVTERTFYILN